MTGEVPINDEVYASVWQEAPVSISSTVVTVLIVLFLGWWETECSSIT
jgi:hypothetical protein